MKKLRSLASRSRKGALVAVLVAGSALAVAAPKASAQSTLDLSAVGTASGTAATTGASSALPVFGAMVAIGAITMGFRKLAH